MHYHLEWVFLITFRKIYQILLSKNNCQIYEIHRFHSFKITSSKIHAWTANWIETFTGERQRHNSVHTLTTNHRIAFYCTTLNTDKQLLINTYHCGLTIHRIQSTIIMDHTRITQAPYIILHHWCITNSLFDLIFLNLIDIICEEV